MVVWRGEKAYYKAFIQQRCYVDPQGAMDSSSGTLDNG